MAHARPSQAASSVRVGNVVYAVGDWNECSRGVLAAFNGTTGASLWQYSNGSPHPRQTPALDEAAGLLFFGSSAIEARSLADEHRAVDQ